jgi:hypothetical protein
MAPITREVFGIEFPNLSTRWHQLRSSPLYKNKFSVVHLCGQTKAVCQKPLIYLHEISTKKFGWRTWIPAKTRVADQNLLACSAFVSGRGGRLSALWTMFVDQRKAQVRARCSLLKGPMGRGPEWVIHDGFAHKSAAEPGVPSTPCVFSFSTVPRGPKARIGPTSGRGRGRAHASLAISGRGRAYSTFRADRFSHQW